MAIFTMTAHAASKNSNSNVALTGYKITNIKSDIKNITNSTPIDIEFTQSTTQAVKLVCPSVYKPYILFTFKNGWLTIKISDKLDRNTRNEMNKNLRNSKIYISAGLINYITVNGSSKFQVTNSLKVENLGVTLNGSGDIIFNDVQATEYGIPGDVTVTLNGSGDIAFTKKITANNASMSLNGSGDIKCQDIDAETIIFSMNGSGDIEVGRATSLNATYNLNGSGDIDANHQIANNIHSQISGSGDINIEGKCDIALLQVTSSGDIDASDLEATKVSATITGSGSIECFAQKSLTTKITGSGEVRYKGNPKVTMANIKKGYNNVRRL